MEAMACGLPVVCSRIRGNTDLIEDGAGGFLHPPNDLNGFSESIRKLIDNHSLCEHMGSHNLDTVKPYNKATITGQIIDVYREIGKL